MALVCHARREELEGEEEEVVVEDPYGVNIEQSAQCLLLLGTTTGHFLLSGWRNGMKVIAPLTNEELGMGRRPPRSVPLGQGVPWGGTAVALSARACWDYGAAGLHFGG